MIILSIGNNTLILQALTQQLSAHSYKATWTNHPETVSTLYNGNDLDLVVFGDGIGQKTRLFIKKIFSVQNPAIIFVDGIAPIPALLAEQVKHLATIAAGRNGNPVKEIAVSGRARSVNLIATAECQVKIRLYHLSLLYKATEKMIAVKNIIPGSHTFNIDKKDTAIFGKHYLVVTANNKPLHVSRF